VRQADGYVSPSPTKSHTFRHTSRPISVGSEKRNKQANLFLSAHFGRGVAGDGKRLALSPQQPPLAHDPSSQYLVGAQPPGAGRSSGDLPYQEQTAPAYDDFQQPLPSINSLLGSAAQANEPQQTSPHRRGLTNKVQSSPNLRDQAVRQARSPYGGSGLRSRSQAFNTSTAAPPPPRRDPGALVVPQSWRDDTSQDQFFSQPSGSYSLDPQTSQRPPPQPPQISPVRTTVQQPYISPQETPTAPGFDFPYYPSDPSMNQPMSTPTQASFYPSSTPTYMGPGPDMMPMQSPYSFNSVVPTMPTSGVSYVGDSRAMLQGRAVSMGSLRAPQRMGISPQEEDKRRRAASASARFRRRKKEQEEENLREINRLEKKIEDLKKE
jgi:hypothetical protein